MTKRKRYPKKPTKKALASAEAYLAPGDYLIRATLEQLDHVAAAMERKWGIDELPNLVSAETAAKFASARDKLDAAIGANDAALVKLHGEALRRGWVVLDQEAAAAGHAPLAAEVWECVLPSTGEVVALTRTKADASRLALGGEYAVVFALDEIALLIEGTALLRAVKEEFPGAEVVAVGDAVLDWEKGDAIPF